MKKPFVIELGSDTNTTTASKTNEKTVDATQSIIIQMGKQSEENDNHTNNTSDVKVLHGKLYIQLGETKKRISSSDIKLSINDIIHLNVGKIKQIGFSASPDFDFESIEWYSTDPDVISVDEYGTIKALKQGTAYIYVVIDGVKSRSIEVISKDIIEFSDKRVEQICIKNWDTDGDNQISFDEAAAVTDSQFLSTIFVNSGIKSFNELKYFTSLTTLPEYAFSDCKKLSSIELPSSITTINSYVFDNCSSLTNITIPENVNTIYSYAFNECNKLSDITCYSSTPATAYTDIFNNLKNLESIYVPEGSEDIYCETDGWSQYKSYINNYGFDYTFDFYLS